MIQAEEIGSAWKRVQKRNAEVFPLLEPSVTANREAFITIEAAAAISSAISLKRIADFLNGKPDGSTMDLVQYVTDVVHKERRS